MDNTTLPFCPYCDIVVAKAADVKICKCINCERDFKVIKNDNNTFTTKKLD